MMRLGKDRLALEDQAGDAQVVEYLYRVILHDCEWTNCDDIYLYLCAKLMLSSNRVRREDRLPNEFRKALDKGLTDRQQAILRALRHQILVDHGIVR